MVNRLKYKTNKRVRKGIAHLIDNQVHQTHFSATVDDSTANYGAKEFKDGSDSYFKFYVDTSHYEKIDKKERKKVYSKLKASGKTNSDSDNDTSASLEEGKVEFATGKKAKEAFEYCSWERQDKISRRRAEFDEAQRYEERQEQRLNAKKGKKAKKLYGNPNHIAKEINVASEIELTPKDRKDYVVRFDGKNTLYNGDFTPHSVKSRRELKDMGRSKKKRETALILKGDLGNCPDYKRKK